MNLNGSVNLTRLFAEVRSSLEAEESKDCCALEETQQNRGRKGRGRGRRRRVEANHLSSKEYRRNQGADQGQVRSEDRKVVARRERRDAEGDGAERGELRAGEAPADRRGGAAHPQAGREPVRDAASGRLYSCLFDAGVGERVGGYNLPESR